MCCCLLIGLCGVVTSHVYVGEHREYEHECVGVVVGGSDDVWVGIEFV